MMLPNFPKPSLLQALFLFTLACTSNLPVCHVNATLVHPHPPSVLGTWKGESICFGNRPACKNEVVVYRFEAIPGKAKVVTLFADKIIEGKADG